MAGLDPAIHVFCTPQASGKGEKASKPFADSGVMSDALSGSAAWMAGTSPP
jgi:hypothetical protein